MRVVFVHGACVKDGSWWWHRTAELLDLDGITSSAPLLPSCGETAAAAGSQGAGFGEDVASVRAELEKSHELTVIVAHSYGGIVVAEAADGVAGVQSVIYVSSYLPEPGETLATFAGSKPAPFLAVDASAGTFAVRPSMFLDTFMSDCPRDVATESVHHLASQSASVTQQPVRAAAWKQTPSLYVVCADDRGTPAARQRQFAARADRVVELPTGHHPFLARPDAMAEVVRSVM